MKSGRCEFHGVSSLIRRGKVVGVVIDGRPCTRSETCIWTSESFTLSMNSLVEKYWAHTEMHSQYTMVGDAMKIAHMANLKTRGDMAATKFGISLFYLQESDDLTVQLCTEAHRAESFGKVVMVASQQVAPGSEKAVHNSTEEA